MTSNWIWILMTIGVMFITLSYEKPLHSNYNDDYIEDVKNYNDQTMEIEKSRLFQNLLLDMHLVPAQPNGMDSGSYVELVRDVREPDVKKTPVTSPSITKKSTLTIQCFFKICQMGRPSRTTKK
ncbi:hypothetical protein CHUAL_007543 [Chamberlinius hualienensis]